MSGGIPTSTAPQSTPEPFRFRPVGWRRHRVAAGVALGAIAIAGNVVVYTSLDDRESVVQAVQDIPAGDRLTPDLFRVIEADLDSSVNVVSGDRLGSLTGAYARVRIVSGSLVVDQAIQQEPLVQDGRAVVAVVVPAGEVPIGLRERVPVQIVLSARSVDEPLRVIDGRIVGLPVDDGTGLGARSISVEVGTENAPAVAAAERVRLVLVRPRPDPAAEG